MHTLIRLPRKQSVRRKQLAITWYIPRRYRQLRRNLTRAERAFVRRCAREDEHTFLEVLSRFLQEADGRLPYAFVLVHTNDGEVDARIWRRWVGELRRRGIIVRARTNGHVFSTTGVKIR
ncbi:MAG: hypothetical protein HY341_02675 [Candidatus Kerfeldbacteria bacterium]|nr:hypothetical protein [Candidatus Kerfeldbacteria bacterium]